MTLTDAVAYYRAICNVALPQDVIPDLRENWTKFLFGDPGTDERYWAAFLGIAFTQSAQDNRAS